MEKFKDHFIISNLISSYMRSHDYGLFTTRTVGELLWGYEDGLLQAIQTVRPEVDNVFGLFHKVSVQPMNTFCTDQINAQKVLDTCKAFFFSFYMLTIFVSQSNASNDGEYVFFTGQQNYKDFARVDTWNGNR